MKRVRILLALLISTFAYTTISFVAGKNGLICYSHLLEQKKEIASRTDKIQNINNELKLEYDALLKDKDVLRAYARRLDFVQDGEKIVKITGLKANFNEIYDIGTVLKSNERTYISENICKIISLIIGGLSLIIMLLFDISKGNISFNKSNKTIIKGIPVYEVPQV